MKPRGESGPPDQERVFRWDPGPAWAITDCTGALGAVKTHDRDGSDCGGLHIGRQRKNGEAAERVAQVEFGFILH